MGRVDVNDLDHPGLAAAVKREMRTMSVDKVVAKSGGKFSNTWLRSVREATPSTRQDEKLVALSLALGQPKDWAHNILHREASTLSPALGDEQDARITRLEVLVGLREPDENESPEETAVRAAALGLFAARVAAMAQPSRGGGGSSRRGATLQAVRTPRRRAE